MTIRFVNRPLNHRRWTFIYLLTILFSLMFAPYAHSEVARVSKPKPIVEYSWPVESYIDHWLYMKSLIGVSYQTTDCNHNGDSIDYYDNLRFLPGYVLSIEGTDVTLRTADKHGVTVRTFHLTDQTLFFTEKKLVATPVDRTYFESHKDGCWVVRYCAHCRVAYKLIRVEV